MHILGALVCDLRGLGNGSTGSCRLGFHMRFGLVVQILFVGVLGRINAVLRNGLDSGFWNLVQYIQGCVLSFFFACLRIPVFKRVFSHFRIFCFFFTLIFLMQLLYII